MKRSIQEIGTESSFDPEAGPNPWANRMKWKPHGNPLLHPDEEAALADPDALPTADDFIDEPPGSTTTIGNPAAAHVTPINQQPENPRFGWKPGDQGSSQRPVNPRFQWKPEGGGAVEKPSMNYMGRGDVDAIMQQIKAEEALPPHKQNAAKISQLKAEAMRMMSREESRRIQRQADRLIPRVEG